MGGGGLSAVCNLRLISIINSYQHLSYHLCLKIMEITWATVSVEFCMFFPYLLPMDFIWVLQFHPKTMPVGALTTLNCPKL